MEKLQVYLARIRQACPELLIGRASFVVEGQNNDVLIVNDEFAFRFPKHDKAVKRLETECAILNGIQAYITSVEVPVPLYTSLSSYVGQAFVGYKIIAGEVGTLEEFEDIRNPSLAFQLATFLRELHSVPAREAISLKLPVSDGREYWAAMYSRIRQLLFRHMRPDARKKVEELFESFLSDNSNFGHYPVLRHGDIGPDQLILDKESWTINGVIDFGSAGLGDPAVDLAWLHFRSGASPAFLSSFYTAYPEIEAVLPRARFYAGTFALQEALFGAEHNDSAAFHGGIRQFA